MKVFDIRAVIGQEENTAVAVPAGYGNIADSETGAQYSTIAQVEADSEEQALDAYFSQ